MMDPQTLFVVALIFLLAGGVKGVSGMGLPAVAMKLLASIMTPLAAAALIVVPSLLTNVWQLFDGRALGTLVVRFRMMLILTFVGALMGSRLMVSLDPEIIARTLGATLIVYAAYGLLWRPVVIAPRWERFTSPVSGALTGLLTGATGISVVPLAPYLQSLDLSKDDFVQALGLSFTISMTALAIGLAANGALSLGASLLSALFVIPAVTGMALGAIVRRRISPTVFRYLFFVALLLLGAQMIF